MKRYIFLIGLFSIFFIYDSTKADPCSIDYREHMRNFVVKIKKWVKRYNPDGTVVVQNGYDLLTDDGTPYGNLVQKYLNAIDGQAVEDLFYGWYEDDEPTPPSEQSWITGYLDRLLLEGKKVFTTDYVFTPYKIDDAINQALSRGYIPFPAPDRELNTIPSYPPTPVNENSDDINSLSDVQNYLYLINPENFSTRKQLVNALDSTTYDMLIIDAYHFKKKLRKKHIHRLKTKPDGSRRLVLAYISIGEAEDYRWYWKPWWYENPPNFLGPENPYWEGNYLVKYWDKKWQKIIKKYVRIVMKAGFDGVFLDKVDAFEDWENYYGCDFYGN